jgi:hypothetical protein
MVYFQTKNPQMGKFWRDFNGKSWYILWPLEHITANWYILWQFGNLCSGNLVYFAPFGKLCKIKSGNPGRRRIGNDFNSAALNIKDRGRTVIRFARWFILRPKIPNLDIFWRAINWKMLVYFTSICYHFGQFNIIYGLLV